MTKKISCIFIFSLIVVVFSVTCAFANNYQVDRAAEICREIGVLRGGVNGVDSEYLSELTTRLQAMHITTRLIGKENVALTYVWTENFSDVSLVDYESGRNLLAYVKMHPDLGWQGDLDGKINPSGYMNAQAMYKVLLSVLGYKPGEDFLWEDVVDFAERKGMKAAASKRGFLTNNEIAKMLVEALKTRMKNSEATLCEYLTEIGVINENAAYDASMLPGSPEFTPLLSYKNGGPLLVGVELMEEQKKVSIRFNTELNPTYAKALKNYNYFMPGAGYISLPGKCMTSMTNESTVVIQFPNEGWLAYSDHIETDAFLTYIASDRKNELRVSGLFDVDGNKLRDIYIDVPAPLKNGGRSDAASYNSGSGSSLQGPSMYLR
jgi:hypothetical protein